jgi:hypothetical protein
MSWTVIGTVTLVYWILLFVRRRARGRRELEHAVDQASRGRAPGESFEVVVSTDGRPLRVAAIVMAVPIALVVIHFFAARSAP